MSVDTVMVSMPDASLEHKYFIQEKSINMVYCELWSKN